MDKFLSPMEQEMAQCRYDTVLRCPGCHQNVCLKHSETKVLGTKFLIAPTGHLRPAPREDWHKETLTGCIPCMGYYETNGEWPYMVASRGNPHII